MARVAMSHGAANASVTGQLKGTSARGSSQDGQQHHAVRGPAGEVNKARRADVTAGPKFLPSFKSPHGCSVAIMCPRLVRPLLEHAHVQPTPASLFPPPPPQETVCPRLWPAHAHACAAQTVGSSACRRGPLCTRPPPASSLLQLPNPTTASHGSSASASAPPASPLPARWSITNRIFNLNLRALYNAPPRLPASRLWNPVNSSPRTLAVQYPRSATRDRQPNVPVQRPQSGTRDEYPLLTLPEQRRSRQSPAPSSLVVERSTGDDSGRTSIGLPRDRRSLPIESQPPTPQPAMVVQQEPAGPGLGADVRDDAPIPGPPPDDLEAGATIRKPSPARVSLPPSRPTSMHSHAASARGHGDGDGDGDDASEFPWGPSHPCFPHPNPHVPLHSELYDNTRIIRIKRDWMVKGDLAPTFANLYPEILDPLITEDEFRKIIQRINDTLMDAFDPFSFRAWLDSVMGVATFWLWDDAGLTKVKRKLSELERWVEDWNRHSGEKEGVRIIPLRRTGYLTLDIQIPDPHLGPDNATSSRPNTQQDDLQNVAPQQQHGEYGPFPVTPTLQVNASSPVAIEGQS
ncbi:hypothetical protein BU26DRAFT_548414 [Trematosphaeria pertusa]|uniref:Ras modification protein ERF4 n=1 Tax=Trematosphaeria pertusa TaxID=390896 RepID=A0A6A6IV48_9PLEO|nr:uncharacterized protein BU26DRAFT_548414 [Trematosphaeria pertusa]KAF2254108.1 hypothetical protein BU26DRAFT_548414 [Trematosphaeria pertusa]